MPTLLRREPKQARVKMGNPLLAKPSIIHKDVSDALADIALNYLLDYEAKAESD